jgi:hypothetical protein
VASSALEKPLGIYTIEATPIDPPPGKRAQGGGGAGDAGVNVGKALVCVATIQVLWKHKGEHEALTWEVDHVVVNEVKTPDAEFEAPHHRHRHHHHG